MPCLPSKQAFLASTKQKHLLFHSLLLAAVAHPNRDSSMSSTRPRSLRTALLQAGRLACSALFRACIVATYADSEAKDLHQDSFRDQILV